VTYALVHEAPALSRRDIILWWELRRIPYNLVLAVVGFVTLFLVIVAGSAAVEPGVDFVEPLVIAFGVPLYAIAANVCYTDGWILDAHLVYQGRLSKALFYAGFAFSIALTALPGIWAVFVWLVTVVTGDKIE
jgi:hypothetical protein